jgi:hypothetical protein
VIFGLFPALEVTAVDLHSALAEASRNGTASRRQHKCQILVFAEVALGVVLVVSAGLFLRTLFTLLHIDSGFRAKNVVTASLSLQDARYKTTESDQPEAELLQGTLDLLILKVLALRTLHGYGIVQRLKQPTYAVSR